MTDQLPTLPQEYEHLYENADQWSTSTITATCNCNGQNVDIDKCPHLQNKALLKTFQLLPVKLAHIDKFSEQHKNDIRKQLFNDIITKIIEQKCTCEFKIETIDLDNSTDEQDELLSQHTQQEYKKPTSTCHIFKDLETLFPEEYRIFFEKQIPIKQKKCSLPNIMINFSFYSAFVLLAIKIIALVASKSMSILSSVVDSVADILCGIILYASVGLARKGVEAGKYQQLLHDNNEKKIKYMYASRFESLGVLAFSAIMGTFVIFLIKEAIGNIVDMAGGQKSEVTFEVLPMVIIGFTIVLKLILAIICWRCSKLFPNEQYEAIVAYRDDHRNDTLVNSIGFIGATLAFYCGGDWAYCDPVASIILCLYILWNWVVKAIEQMRILSGFPLEQEVMDEYMMHAIHGRVTSTMIKRIWLTGYSSASRAVLEFRVVLDDSFSLYDAHELVSAMEHHFENIENVERCYVHVECETSKHNFV